MASTYSTSLRLELMATGDQSGTWGDTTNTNLGTLLEQAITGVLSVTQGDAELTLTSLDGASDQARNMVVNLTGAMTGPQNVVVPAANKVYLIKNSTTGGFAVTVKTSAGSGVTVPATTARWVYCDGTNVVDGMSGPWAPSSNDAQALGLSGTAWSDLFLASGGVINWNAGDVTITHSANTLAFAGASSGYTFDALISGTTATFTGSFTAGSFSLESTDAGAAAAPILTLYRNSASPAANDVLGQVLFNGEDSAGNTQEYGSIQAVIGNPTSTSEDGSLDFYAPVAGTRTLIASLGPGITGAVIATQAQQEAGSAANVIVTPSTQQFHQSALKFSGYVTVSAGTPTLASSYNVTGIADTGVGRLTVTIATDFSSANWSSWLTITAATTGVRTGKIAPSSKAAGSVEYTCVDGIGNGADPDAYDFGATGDQ